MQNGEIAKQCEYQNKCLKFGAKDITQDWKVGKKWNPFHEQNSCILMRFSGSECTGKESWYHDMNEKNDQICKPHYNLILEIYLVI